MLPAWLQVAEPGFRTNDARGVGMVFGPDVTEVRAGSRGWLLHLLAAIELLVPATAAAACRCCRCRQACLLSFAMLLRTCLLTLWSTPPPLSLLPAALPD